MARIAWSIMGDSRGHLTRALIMAEALRDHELLFVGGGCVEELAALGHRVCRVPMLTTVLRNSRTLALPTALVCARAILGAGETVRALRRELERFGADCAVSDYEFFLPRAARAMGLPCLSFDHQHVVSKCRPEVPPGPWLSGRVLAAIVRGVFSLPERYLVTSFFPAPPKGPDTTLVPPLLRPDVAALRPEPSQGGILAYFRGGLPGGLLEALSATGRRVDLYGQGEGPGAGNVRFRATERAAFLEDLARAEYVVANGGHNLISEALHLRKPVLVAASLFAEQELNAWNLLRMGLGGSYQCGEPLPRLVRGFEAGLEGCAARMAGMDVFGNARVEAALRAFIRGDAAL